MSNPTNLCVTFEDETGKHEVYFQDGDIDFANRVAACVTACDGMENPAEEIQALRDELESFDGAIKL